MTHGGFVMDGWMLGFDASTPATVVVCGRIGEPEPRASYTLPAGANQASERLVEHVVETVRAAGITMQAITALAVGRGPGTFTGTRVALATAKGMARGLGLPLHPVSTLACVAASAPLDVWPGGEGETAAGITLDGALVAVLDARKGEVYAGPFTHDPDASPHGRGLAPRSEEHCIAPTGLIASLQDEPHVVLVGPGVAPYASHWPSTWRVHPLAGPTPLGLWLVASAAVQTGATADPGRVDATYLRASYAELGINVPKRSVWRNPVLDEA